VIYSAGLRISELTNLKIKDIDSERKQIRIEQSKGKKDRYSLLSIKTLDLLRTYFKKYKPKEWLFEGQEGGQYSTRSIQTFFQEICKKSRNKKESQRTYTAAQFCDTSLRKRNRFALYSGFIGVI
jgi:integrase/recombinase XerD